MKAQPTQDAATHTPTPWHAAGLTIHAARSYNAPFDGRLRDYHNPIALIDGDPLAQAAELFTDPHDGQTSRVPGWEEAAANAKLIVRAVNSHAALVAALEKVALFGENPTALAIGHTAALMELGRNARSALALARGNQ